MNGRLPPPAHDPIAAALSTADDRVVLSHWLPPNDGIVPRIRIGQRSVSTLWALPIGAAGVILLITIARSLRELPGVQSFISKYPDVAQSAPSIDSSFP
jgi:sulfoxide reductase catalytic subunit YedY